MKWTLPWLGFFVFAALIWAAPIYVFVLKPLNDACTLVGTDTYESPDDRHMATATTTFCGGAGGSPWFTVTLRTRKPLGPEHEVYIAQEFGDKFVLHWLDPTHLRITAPDNISDHLDHDAHDGVMISPDYHDPAAHAAYVNRMGEERRR